MKTKILIAEDEKIVALDIRNQLQGLNYEITSIVSTGEDAISECRKQRPDVVLMDIQLKGIKNGLQAASEIYSEMRIPIIHLTGSGKRIFDKNLMYPLLFLSKPFEKRELREILEKVLKS
jgi:CheY-like chemotaxis protein